MPTRKITDIPPAATCTSSDHNPPAHMVWPDGVYEHECRACGRTLVFTAVTPRYVSTGTPYTEPLTLHPRAVAVSTNNYAELRRRTDADRVLFGEFNNDPPSVALALLDARDRLATLEARAETRVTEAMVERAERAFNEECGDGAVVRTAIRAALTAALAGGASDGL